MTTDRTNQFNVRLSDEVYKMALELSKKYITQSAVVHIAIRELYYKEKMKEVDRKQTLRGR